MNVFYYIIVGCPCFCIFILHFQMLYDLLLNLQTEIPSFDLYSLITVKFIGIIFITHPLPLDGDCG